MLPFSLLWGLWFISPSVTKSLIYWLHWNYIPVPNQIKATSMGLRFQKRITLFKGFTINLIKTGASVSVGPRGAKLNIRGDKVTGNIGIPGTGISYRQRLDNPEGTEKTAHAEPIQEPHPLPVEDEVPSRELSWKVFGLISFAGLVYVTYLLLTKQ